MKLSYLNRNSGHRLKAKYGILLKIDCLKCLGDLEICMGRNSTRCVVESGYKMATFTSSMQNNGYSHMGTG